MKQVSRLGEFPKGCLIAQFSGKSVDEAVSNAEHSGLNVISYFDQGVYGRSRCRTILVYYKKGDENDQN